MKNKKVLFGIMGLVAIIIVNTVVFVSVKELTTARWINIGFLNLSLIIAYFFSIMFGKKEYKFMNYSRLPIVGIYSAVTFILSAIFIICNLKSIAITIVVQIILLGLFVIVLSTNTMANNSAESSLEEDRRNFSKVDDMARRLSIILKMVDNREVYRKIEKAYDSVKNTKLAIREDTTQIDNDILQAISIIEYNVQNQSYGLIDEQVNKINNLIIKRNLMK